MLLTYALVLILDDLVRVVWGGDPRNVARPELLAGSVNFLGLALPTYNVFILLVGPVIALGLWFLLYRTRAGNVIRATVSYPDTLGSLGVNVSWVMTCDLHAGMLVGRPWRGADGSTRQCRPRHWNGKDHRVLCRSGDRRPRKRRGSAVGVPDYWSRANILPTSFWPVGAGLPLCPHGPGPCPEAVGAIWKTGTVGN